MELAGRKLHRKDSPGSLKRSAKLNSKVLTNARGDIVNLYIEPQYSVYQSGVGSPTWQIFSGVTFKLPIAKGQKER